MLVKGCILYESKDDRLLGFPSGMTTDDEDNLWVACFNGGQVRAGKTVYIYSKF